MCAVDSRPSQLAMGAAVSRSEQGAEGGRGQRQEAGDGRSVKFELEEDEAEDQQKARDLRNV
jgi:hypothetical protein